MAGEENGEVTYTVKITITLTVPHPETQPTTLDVNAETAPLNGDNVAQAIDFVTETASLNNGDDVVAVAAEQSVP
ncbi:lysine-specific demethylase 3B, partial [Trifolium medium]|nr:lysine-specific demethylase 3B [Trifolium medium]